jgi:hypothetical protein
MAQRAVRDLAEALGYDSTREYLQNLSPKIFNHPALRLKKEKKT